jgi:Fe-S cluster assembly protein SufB
MSEQEQQLRELAVYKYGFRDEDARYEFVVPKGLSKEVVEAISHYKGEPDWMRKIRLQALEIFFRKPMPTWGADLSELNFDEITYYAAPTKAKFRSWDEVPEYIKRTYERLGIPEAERKFLAGLGAQYDSEVVYHRIREDLERLGVIFVDMDTAVREYPDIVREYFGTVIPPTDNKFAALNTAVWSGGSFIYVPKGVHVEMPLQAYFRINAENIGQFERTLIIAEEGSFVHYIEGCLPAGEKVSIGDRWVNIEAIKPGDFVVTATGERRRVRAVMTRYYKGDIVEVVPVSPHNAFRLTPEHPVLAVRRETVAVRRRRRNGWLAEVDTRKLLQAQPTYIPVGELKVGDFLVFPKVKADNSNTAFSPDQLRLLGYYLAEGSAFVHQKLKQPVVSFSFGEHETAAIEEVKELIRKVTGKRPQIVHQPSRHAVNITVYSRELMDFCLRHAGKGADSKQLSPEVMSLPPEQVKVLLDAYFAGDGNTCVKGNGNTWMKRISTASQTLAEQLQELLARMGIYASILKRQGGEDTIRGRRIRRKDQFTVVWTENKRWSEVRDAGDYFLVPIKRIRRIPYDGFVFNMHVEHPNAYLVRGFVAHNCTAPIYSTNSLHSAVVELIAKPGATIRYTTLQNWSHNVYNLVTKRGVAYEDAKIIWVDANIGSKVTMKYPCVYMVGKGARGEVLSVAFASNGQHQDAGAKMIHAAPYTTSIITSKSISVFGGRATYRGMVKVYPGCKGAKVNVRCDALLLDEISRTDTYPVMEIEEEEVEVAHEATVSKIGEEQLFYLQSRGLTDDQAIKMIVNGFFRDFAKELPMEYAVEFTRLIELQLEGSVG